MTDEIPQYIYYDGKFTKEILVMVLKKAKAEEISKMPDKNIIKKV